MGQPVETASLQDLFADADRQIKELYKLAGDKGIRSIEDAKAINDKMQEVMKPVRDAAAKAKTLKTKSEITASFGFSARACSIWSAICPWRSQSERPASH
jgi:hypothetical protein